MQLSSPLNIHPLQLKYGSVRVQHADPFRPAPRCGDEPCAGSHARAEGNRFHRLILLGDIFADLNFARLTKDHWKFLGYIRKLSNPKRNVEVVWVEGNHDHGLANIMSHLVGVRSTNVMPGNTPDCATSRFMATSLTAFR